MLGVEGRVQREGGVVHVVAHRLHDLSRLLDSLGERDVATLPPHGPGNEARTADEANPRDAGLLWPGPRDIFIPDLSLEAIRAKTRDAR